MDKIILTCEHGGAVVPKTYASLFKPEKNILRTHRALDIGALALAKKIFSELNGSLPVSLDFCNVTRLIVDTNRNLDSDSLFSEFTRDLDAAEKLKIIERFYSPHRRAVSYRIRRAIENRSRVFHIGVHSMTEKLNGRTRLMQIAVLYDPSRPNERKFVRIWTAELKKLFPLYKITRNNPYRGNSAGPTSSLRSRFTDKMYLGLELEANQKLLRNFGSKERLEFAKKIAASIALSVEKMPKPTI
jgi:predicted N-formylglutamate amidohydrolase